MEEKTEGILLQSIPYLGSKKILKVLTPDLGLISLICKMKNQPAPFCIAEWVLRKNQKDLYPVIDFSLIDPLLHLRSDFTTLLTAGILASDLLKTQLPGKKAPFALACTYFKKLSLSPNTLLASFRLKLLLYEGLLSSEETTFSPSEWQTASTLAFSRQFSEIIQVQNIPFSKIQSLFQERFT
jgi:DNA repair protein RecO